MSEGSSTRVLVLNESPLHAHEVTASGVCAATVSGVDAINDLTVLEVLLEELDTSIDAVLDLVVCVYLDGYIVPERI